MEVRHAKHKKTIVAKEFAVFFWKVVAGELL
jgi:hypothetical protein